jgi:hypothetical protein
MSEAYQCDVCKDFVPDRGGIGGSSDLASQCVEIGVGFQHSNPFMHIALTLTPRDTMDDRLDVCPTCCRRILGEGLVKMGWLPER